MGLLFSGVQAADFYIYRESSSQESSHSDSHSASVTPSHNETVISQPSFTPNNYNNSTVISSFNPQPGGLNNVTRSYNNPAIANPLNSNMLSQPGTSYNAPYNYNNPAVVSLSLSQPGGGYNTPNSYNNTTVITSLNTQPGVTNYYSGSNYYNHAPSSNYNNESLITQALPATSTYINQSQADKINADILSDFPSAPSVDKNDQPGVVIPKVEDSKAKKIRAE